MIKNRLKLDVFNRFKNQHFIEEINEWELTKKYDDYTVQLSLDKPFVFTDPTAYKYLLEMAVKGPHYLETSPITDAVCGVSLPNTVYCVSGEFDTDKCSVEKKVDLNKELRFSEDVNIFDAAASEVATFDGLIERKTFSKTISANNPILTFTSLLSLFTLPNYEAEGYYMERVDLEARAVTGEVPNLDEKYYIDHNVEVFIKYVKISSTYEIPDWIPHGNVYIYEVPALTVTGGVSDVVDLSQNELYYSHKYTAKATVEKIENSVISNTRDFNEVLDSLFSVPYISNFFDVNSDSTQPENKYYTYASDWLHHLRIVQSFDVINEDAIDSDSFGNSGKVNGEKLISDLNKMFNLVLIYDPLLNLIRHEHVTYFRQKQVDFSGNKNYTIEPLKFNENDIKSETWQMPTSGNDKSHYSTTIEYLATATDDKTYSINEILTDVFYFLNNEEEEQSSNEDKFFLLCTDGSDNLVALNTLISIKNLVRVFHDINRPSRLGVQDKENVNFISTSIGITSEISTIESLSSFLAINPEMAIKLNEGTFYVDELSINESNELTIKIKK